MVKINFEINGQSVSTADLKDALQVAITEELQQRIRSKLAGVRDPETGEFPLVAVQGSGLEDLSFEVTGSPELLEIANQRLGNDFGTAAVVEDAAINSEKAVIQRSPVAFLSYASENKELAARIAKDFQKQGIETFFAEWEIGPGESIRAKIDDGLGNCTHFVVLLTPESVEKPWVNTEIDAGFVAKVGGHCKFIPLRFNLPVERLSPLLRALHAPALESYDGDISGVIDWIHGVSKKPPLGPPPRVIDRASGKLGLSPAAEAIVRLFIERSANGRKFDPSIDSDSLRKEVGL